MHPHHPNIRLKNPLLQFVADEARLQGRTISNLKDSYRVGGIYKIICIPSGKFYLGSAVNVYDRIGEHVREALKGRQRAELQRDWDEYGGYAFRFEIVERCSRRELLTREQKWLCLLQPWRPEIGYNLRKEAVASYDYRFDKSGKERMSESLKNYFKDPRNLERHRQSVQCSFQERRELGLPFMYGAVLPEIREKSHFKKGNDWGSKTKGIAKPFLSERNKKLKWVTAMARRRAYCLRGKTSFIKKNRLTVQGKRKRRFKQIQIESRRRFLRCLQGKRAFDSKFRGFEPLVPIINFLVR